MLLLTRSVFALSADCCAREELAARVACACTGALAAVSAVLAVIAAAVAAAACVALWLVLVALVVARVLVLVVTRGRALLAL